MSAIEPPFTIITPLDDVCRYWPAFTPASLAATPLHHDIRRHARPPANIRIAISHHAIAAIVITPLRRHAIIEYASSLLLIRVTTLRHYATTLWHAR